MESIVQSIVIYFFVLLVMRVIGQRVPSQLTPFEILIVLLFGGMATRSIIGQDQSLTNAILCIVTVGMVHILVSTLKSRFPLMEGIIDGVPVIVFSHGEWHRQNMFRMRINEQDVMAQARKQGVKREEQIKYAIVERSGAISIIRKSGREEQRE